MWLQHQFKWQLRLEKADNKRNATLIVHRCASIASFAENHFAIPNTSFDLFWEFPARKVAPLPCQTAIPSA
jgi:hypothetical protein